ncbi:hypothetical protein EGR_02288 [Echinococcus granulosus]|uniref:Uncharacterized protein n=1 Tax=Echinococcus granulosus TaxID=6210 RepID=W6UWJ0_ECHGR|nr:hypothetical protein EGR_02288 [Echinococcus granulosus]EUB62847.1 hypothetical protein EGR_02288 [Echinococcus granulosus]
MRYFIFRAIKNEGIFFLASEQMRRTEIPMHSKMRSNNFNIATKIQVSGKKILHYEEIEEIKSNKKIVLLLFSGTLWGLQWNNLMEIHSRDAILSKNAVDIQNITPLPGNLSSRIKLRKFQKTKDAFLQCILITRFTTNLVDKIYHSKENHLVIEHEVTMKADNITNSVVQ